MGSGDIRMAPNAVRRIPHERGIQTLPRMSRRLPLEGGGERALPAAHVLLDGRTHPSRITERWCVVRLLLPSFPPQGPLHRRGTEPAGFGTGVR